MSKLVSEYLFEKFTQDSDPIHDLGIGVFVPHNFKTQQEILDWIWAVLPAIYGGEIPKDIIKCDDIRFFNRNYGHTLENYIDKYISYNGGYFSRSWEFNNALHNALIRKGCPVAKKFNDEFKKPHYKDKINLKIDN